MGRSVSLLIFGDAGEGTANKRSHWRAKAKLVERWRERTALILLQSSVQDWHAERVQITFTLYRGRYLDPDNAAGSICLKSVVDALKGKLFPDDSHRHVQYGPIRQEVSREYGRQPAVGVLVEEMEPATTGELRGDPFPGECV